MEIVKGQPLTLPDGSVLLPVSNDAGSKVMSADDVAEHEEHEKIVEELSDALEDAYDNEFTQTYKRTVADIDMPLEQMNIIMLTASYTMWGLDSFGVSRVLGVDESTIDRLKQSDAYSETMQQLTEALRYAEASTVHGYIAHKAKTAAKVVVSSLKNKSADIRMAAAKDILDRAGYRPADRVEHKHTFDDELRIRYVENEVKVPTIDLSIGDIDAIDS